MLRRFLAENEAASQRHQQRLDRIDGRQEERRQNAEQTALFFSSAIEQAKEAELSRRKAQTDQAFQDLRQAGTNIAANCATLSMMPNRLQNTGQTLPAPQQPKLISHPANNDALQQRIVHGLEDHALNNDRIYKLKVEELNQAKQKLASFPEPDLSLESYNKAMTIKKGILIIGVAGDDGPVNLDSLLPTHKEWQQDVLRDHNRQKSKLKFDVASKEKECARERQEVISAIYDYDKALNREIVAANYYITPTEASGIPLSLGVVDAQQGVIDTFMSREEFQFARLSLEREICAKQLRHPENAAVLARLNSDSFEKNPVWFDLNRFNQEPLPSILLSISLNASLAAVNFYAQCQNDSESLGLVSGMAYAASKTVKMANPAIKDPRAKVIASVGGEALDIVNRSVTDNSKKQQSASERAFSEEIKRTREIMVRTQGMDAANLTAFVERFNRGLMDSANASGNSSIHDIVEQEIDKNKTELALRLHGLDQKATADSSKKLVL